MINLPFQKKFKSILYIFFIALLLCSCSQKQDDTTSRVSKPQGAAPDSLFIDQGLALLRQGDLTGAVANLKKAIEVNPKSSKARLILGQTAMQLESYEEAIRRFDEVIRLDPGNGHAYLLLGGCYDLTGEKDKAIEQVKRSMVVYRRKQDEAGFRSASLILQGLLSNPEDQ